MFYADARVPLGLRVILAEYLGYGPRDGDVGERNQVDGAEQAIAPAHRLHGAAVLVIGESLGAGVAAAAAARQRDKVAGLLLITPWDRLAHVAAHHHPWLPVKWLLRDRYDSAVHLASFGRPVMVAIAERDAIVPSSRQADGWNREHRRLRPSGDGANHRRGNGRSPGQQCVARTPGAIGSGTMLLTVTPAPGRRNRPETT